MYSNLNMGGVRCASRCALRRKNIHQIYSSLFRGQGKRNSYLGAQIYIQSLSHQEILCNYTDKFLFYFALITPNALASDSSHHPKFLNYIPKTGHWMSALSVWSGFSIERVKCILIQHKDGIVKTRWRPLWQILILPY